MSNAEPLGAAARAALRALAREAIERAARGEPPAAAPARHPTRLPEIERRGGAFVTLRLRGRLRGCIGRVSAEAPLADVVPAMARAAALDDPRFDPIGPRELAELSFEISVLGPLRRVERPAKAGSFEIGVDGLVVSMGPRSGLLLPQVATEHGFDRIGFLEEACAKAGLPRDAWRSGAEVYAFAAEVF